MSASASGSCFDKHLRPDTLFAAHARAPGELPMKSFCRFLLALAGWRTEGAPPGGSPRFVLIAAPHTSNWDGPLLLLAAGVFGLKLQWFVKKSWFFFPMGIVMRAVGGIPIDRSGKHGMVEQAIARFAAHAELALAVPPEGTRKRVPHWKGGFYHIALGARVPIVLGYLDYGRKVAGLGPAFPPTGEMAADFVFFRDFYSNIKGRYPELVGPVLPPPR
jgi:1-acyl-sn-glycerol-3-phosphate acyltransferase